LIFIQPEHIKCHNCNKYFSTHEEKRTDVNIALKLLGDAFDDLYDKAIIISADSDLLPVIQSVHKYFPDKEIGVMFEVINNRGKELSELEKIKNFFIYYSTIYNRPSLREEVNYKWSRILFYLNKAVKIEEISLSLKDIFFKGYVLLS